jgi:drug/metabolite transporter (DMT)-like permease
MIWFILTLSAIILWGTTDILLKKSLQCSDSLSHYKTFVWIGLIAASSCVVVALYSDTLTDSIIALADNLYLIPVTVFYVVAMFFGLLGAKYLDASVVSPLENIDGAITATILYLFFFLTGKSQVTDGIGIMDIIGTVAITMGVILLGMQEHKLSKQEVNLEEHKKKHRLGALALLFPIAYNLADAVSMVATGITVSGEAEVEIPEMDFFFFECFGFLVISIFVWLYMLIVQKHVYNPFKKAELPRIGAATCETLGTLTFVFAVGINPILTAPITSSYCFVTIILARVFLKERLTKKQYLSVALVIAGIALLGISEIFNA